MHERDKVMGQVRAALKDLPESERTPLPDWPTELVVSRKAPAETSPEALWAAFKRHFEAVHGDPIEALADIPDFLKAKEATEGYLDPALDAAVGDLLREAGLVVHHSFDREQADRYSFGITRAMGLIAETGSIILQDKLTSDRLAFIAPWLHVALVPADLIFETLPAALAELRDDPYYTIATGPSKTADIEGILIEGVHGPGVQACCRI
ncbi:MAG: LutC/YkgG family protein [Verrucomicrobiota bacterium]